MEQDPLRCGWEQEIVRKYSSDKIILTAQEMRDILTEANRDMWDEAEAGRIRIMKLEKELETKTQEWLKAIRERDELAHKLEIWRKED
jgi:hypothetical protein